MNDHFATLTKLQRPGAMAMRAESTLSQSSQCILDVVDLMNHLRATQQAQVIIYGFVEGQEREDGEAIKAILKRLFDELGFFVETYRIAGPCEVAEGTCRFDVSLTLAN